MKIEIFDVELGQCAIIHCPNGQKVLIDAGHNTTRRWHPSTHFYGLNIERLIISNYDEDHVSDIVNLQKNCSIRTIYRNTSISSDNLLAMKTMLGMGNGIRHVYNWLKLLESPNGGILLHPADMAGVNISHYQNTYGTFRDTNNLSLVTFVKYKNFTILFPSDLEVAGWKELLKLQTFRNELATVNVFVASHHGRENGCCEEIFNFCSPQAVIISDGGKQYATQETCNWYANRVSGCKTIGRAERKVLTTRNDGHITLEVTANGDWFIATETEKNSLQRRA